MDFKELDEVFTKNASFGYRSELVKNVLKSRPVIVKA